MFVIQNFTKLNLIKNPILLIHAGKLFTNKYEKLQPFLHENANKYNKL